MDEGSWKDTRQWLLRVVRGGGELLGSFYFVRPRASGAPIEQQGLLVTLKGRDPKGAKLSRQGWGLRKQLRRELQSPVVFAKGHVSAERDDKMLCFDIVEGTLPPERLQKSLKAIGRASPFGLNFAFLVRVRVTSGDVEEAPDEEPTSEDGDALAAALADAAGVPDDEIRDLVAEQETLFAADRSLATLLERDEAFEEVAMADVTVSLGRIEIASRGMEEALAIGDEEGALREAEALLVARAVLARASAELGDPFALEQSFSDVFAATLESTVDALLATLAGRLDGLISSLPGAAADLSDWERSRSNIESILERHHELLG